VCQPAIATLETRWNPLDSDLSAAKFKPLSGGARATGRSYRT
jgi:hypothetical protein